jgi:hypothetical protein
MRAATDRYRDEMPRSPLKDSALYFNRAPAARD